jgi:hypothetical protein
MDGQKYGFGAGVGGAQTLCGLGPILDWHRNVNHENVGIQGAMN